MNDRMNFESLGDGQRRLTMNIRQGAFRIWVVIAVLWVGLVGFTNWDRVRESISSGCWSARYPKTWEEKTYGIGPPMTEEEFKNGRYDNGQKEYSLGDCEYRHLYSKDIISSITLQGLALPFGLPVGLLAVWFVGAWVARGFRSAATSRQ
jgi:hypothetical protein